MSAAGEGAACSSAVRFRIALGDGEVAGWRLPSPNSPPLLFCHANGFCASTYLRMFGFLRGRFDIYAIDLRGHGRTTLPCDPTSLRSWSTYADDIGIVLDRLGPDIRLKWRLAGHSLGATSALLAARGRKDVAGLALIEPVAPRAAHAVLALAPFWPLIARRAPLVKGALARRASFANREAARAAYLRKALFSTWAAGVVDDYLLDGLREAESGVALSCRPDWEAATFAARSWRFMAALKASTAPVAILAAARGSTVHPRSGQAFARLGVKVERAPGATHFLPMESPEGAARFLIGALSGEGLDWRPQFAKRPRLYDGEKDQV